MSIFKSTECPCFCTLLFDLFHIKTQVFYQDDKIKIITLAGGVRAFGLQKLDT